MTNEQIRSFGQYNANIFVVAALLSEGSTVLIKLLSNNDLLAKIDVNAPFPIAHVLPQFEFYFHALGELADGDAMTCLAEISLLKYETHSLVIKLFTVGCNFLSTCGRANGETVYERAIRSNMVARRAISLVTSLLKDTINNISDPKIRGLVETMAEQAVT